MKFLWMAAAALAIPTIPAHANLVLDKVIVDLGPDQLPRDDIELFNEGSERMYVLVEPFLVRNPDTEAEERVLRAVDDVSDLLVSPRRLVLDAGERRLVRLAIIGDRPSEEQIFRVRIRPVVGEVETVASGLQVLVGYDTLVIVRPDAIVGELEVTRDIGHITVVNRSNASQEFYDGRICNSDDSKCTDLSPNRLYPGEVWQIDADETASVSYTRVVAGRSEQYEFPKIVD